MVSDQPAPGPTEIADWTRRAMDGDRQAFDQLYERYAEGLRICALKWTAGRSELADEVVQRTWIAAWEAAGDGRYDPARAAFSTFVYGVAFKMWLRIKRSQRDDAAAVDWGDGAWAALLRDDDDPTAAVHLAELLDALRGCLKAETPPHGLLPAERRIVEGVARGETERGLAEALGVAASTINARKQTAFQKLRRCLAAKGHAGESAEQRGRPAE